MKNETATIIVTILAIILGLGLLALNLYILWVVLGVLFATGHTVIAWLIIINFICSVLFKTTKGSDK